MIGHGKGMGIGIITGALATTAALLLPAALLDGAPVTSGALALIPAFFFVLPAIMVIVALGAALIGLPVVALMAKIECDGAEVLALAGAVAGLGLVWAITLAGSGTLDGSESIFALAALLGGGVTGAAWGRARDAARLDIAPDRPIPRANRIEDRRILR